MLSFLNMYNTMGSKTDDLTVREHFLSKNPLTTAFLSNTILNHPYLKIETFFTGVSENLGHKLSDGP